MQLFGLEVFLAANHMGGLLYDQPFQIADDRKKFPALKIGTAQSPTKINDAQSPTVTHRGTEQTCEYGEGMLDFVEQYGIPFIDRLTSLNLEQCGPGLFKNEY